MIYSKPIKLDFKLIILFLSAVLLFWIRLPQPVSLGVFFASEDGVILINEMQNARYENIYNPVNGYLFCYPKLIAYISSFFNLRTQAYIYTIGWLFSILFLVYVLYIISNKFKFNNIQITSLLFFVLFQPSIKDMAFTLTYSMWILGLGMILYSLVFWNEKPTKWVSFWLIMAGLSGPFSLILTPFLIILAYLTKKFNVILYILIFGCAIIQLPFVMNAPRLAINNTQQAQTIEKKSEAENFSDKKTNTPQTRGTIDSIVIGKAFLYINTFGANTLSILVLSLIFWISFALSFIHYIKNENNSWFIPCLFTMILFAVFFLISSSGYGTFLNSARESVRYFWIYFGVIAVSAFIISNNTIILKYITLLSLSTIAALNFFPNNKEDLQLAAYLNFSKYQSMLLPIQPRAYDRSHAGKEALFWNINKTKGKKLSSDGLLTINLLGKMDLEQGTLLEMTEGSLKARADAGSKLTLLSKEKLHCGSASDIGIKIRISRSYDTALDWDIINLYWDTEKNFSYEKSVTLLYEEIVAKKDRIVHFAFSYPSSGAYIKLEVMTNPGIAELKEITAYCLP